MLTTLVRRLRRKLFPPREVIEGYEHDQLVGTIFQKTKAYKPEGGWPLMAGASAVLDFGGGCGLHYKLAAVAQNSLGRGGNAGDGAAGIRTGHGSPALFLQYRRGCRLAGRDRRDAFE